MSSESAMVLGNGAALDQALTLSNRLAKSGLIPRALQNKPDDVLVVLLRGQELGLGPMQALAGIHVIEGKGVCSADLIVGLCARRREVCEYFRLVESSADRAVYETKRAGSPEPTRLTFTMADAQRAGLTGKDNWKRHPAAMLRARCSAQLARAVYPDLAMGLYDTDEAEDFSRGGQVVPMQAPEKEINPAPAQTRTSQVADAVKRKLTVVDVQPGETDDAALERAKALPPPSEAAMEQILKLWPRKTMDWATFTDTIKRATGKGRAELVLDDVAKVRAALEEPPIGEPPPDVDLPVAP